MEQTTRHKLTVPLSHFVKDVYDVTLNQSEPWLLDIFRNFLSDTGLEDDSLKGQLHLINIGGNVTLDGHIGFKHHPICSRCGEPLTRHEKIVFNAHFTPLRQVTAPHDLDTEGKMDAADEIELTAEDLSFCFYKNDEIEVDPLINDEIALAIPYNYYCEDQKSCETRLNTNLKLHTDGDTDPRWISLKSLKPKTLT